MRADPTLSLLVFYWDRVWCLLVFYWSRYRRGRLNFMGREQKHYYSRSACSYYCGYHPKLHQRHGSAPQINTLFKPYFVWLGRSAY
jgi:hypothetical protein